MIRGALTIVGDEARRGLKRNDVDPQVSTPCGLVLRLGGTCWFENLTMRQDTRQRILPGMEGVRAVVVHIGPANLSLSYR